MVMVMAMIMVMAMFMDSSVSIGSHADALLIAHPGTDSRRNVVRRKTTGVPPARGGEADHSRRPRIAAREGLRDPLELHDPVGFPRLARIG
jgi:hypothetical protein